MNVENVRQEQAKIIRKHQLVRDVVFDVLAEHPRARNDDRWLILKVIEKLGHDIVIGKEQVIWYLTLEKIGEVPAFETITRCRRDIQKPKSGDGMFLPTDPEVLYRRDIAEDAIKTYYSGQPDVIERWMQIKYQVK